MENLEQLLKVNIFGYDDVEITMVTEKIVTARKENNCDHCKQKINIGEKYRRDKFYYVDEKKFISMAHCIPCMKELDK